MLGKYYKLFGFILLINISLSAQTSEEDIWYLAGNSKKYKIEINSTEVRIESSDDSKTLKYWVRRTYHETEKIKGELVNHVMQLVEFDIVNKQSRTLKAYYYNAKGDVIYQPYSYSKEFNLIIPESIGEAEYKAVLKIVADKEQIINEEIAKYKKIAFDLDRGVIYADSLYNINQLDSALLSYKNELNYLEKYSTSWQQKYYPENLPYILLTKINNTQAEIKTNASFKIALNKADSIYNISHDQSIREYENCLKIKQSSTIDKRIDDIKKEIELKNFKSFVLIKKISFDSLQIIKLKNDSTLKNVIIKDREYFRQAYDSLLIYHKITSKNTAYLNQYFTTKQETKINEVDMKFINELAESNIETLAFIAIQRNIISTDPKIIKRQNKELKKSDYKTETIMTIINNRTE